MKKILLSACSLSLCLNAFAASTDNLNWAENWSIGFGINADASSNLQGQPQAFVDVDTDSLELESTAVGFDVYLARAINDHFAIEMGYTFVGNVDLDYYAESGPYTVKVEQWNLHAQALGRWPIGEYVNLMIKGGTAWYENTQNLENIETGAKVHDKYSGFALTYGGGVEVFWDQFGLRADYTALLPPNRADDMLYVSDLLGLSFMYKFM